MTTGRYRADVSPAPRGAGTFATPREQRLTQDERDAVAFAVGVMQVHAADDRLDDRTRETFRDRAADLEALLDRMAGPG